MRNCVIIGASGHGSVVADIIEKQGDSTISGYIDHGKLPPGEFFAYPLLGTEEDLKKIGLCVDEAIVAIGDNHVRQKAAFRFSQHFPDVPFATAVHPDAVIARGVEIQSGTVVMAGAIINSSAHIGEHVIINTRASVDHDCLLHDFVQVAPGVTLGGNVILESGVMVGMGATIRQGVRVGQNAVVGMGAVVTRDVDPNTVVYGVPAKAVATTE